MDKDSAFSSKRLYFRGINETDTDCLIAWRSNTQVIQYFRNPSPILRKDHEQWYRTVYLKDFERFDFLVIEKRSQKKIGTVGVNHIDMRSCSCEISYMIAEPAFQRKGYAVEAIAAMMGVAKKEGISHFYAEIHVDNIASRRTIEKLGYIYCGERYPFITYHRQGNLHGSYTS